MKRFEKILCVIETGTHSEAAVRQAARIASDHQADLFFATVLKAPGRWDGLGECDDGLSLDPAEIIEGERAKIEDWLSGIVPDRSIRVEIYEGIKFIQVIKGVIREKFDLVVKCAQATDWLDRLFGSDDMHLLRKCPCPVLILRQDQAENFRNILATVDVNREFAQFDKISVQEGLNEKVLEYSAALAIPELTGLHIGGAWEAVGEDFYRHGPFSKMPEEKIDLYVEEAHDHCLARLQSLVKAMTDSLGKQAVQYLQPETHLVKGDPAREIPAMAEKYNIDLIVMGTVGRVGVPGFIIGNTAESILQQANCSVLAIKPDGFETPVT